MTRPITRVLAHQLTDAEIDAVAGAEDMITIGEGSGTKCKAQFTTRCEHNGMPETDDWQYNPDD